MIITTWLLQTTGAISVLLDLEKPLQIGLSGESPLDLEDGLQITTSRSADLELASEVDSRSGV
jgi:hypothetical protein